MRWQDFTEQKATLDGKPFAEVREARLNDNANPVGSVQEGSNAVEDTVSPPVSPTSAKSSSSSPITPWSGKASARRVGLDPKLFAGHSLRSGFLTSAAGRGASIYKMMDVSRHRSMDTLRGYVRDAELFRDHAGAGLL